MPDKRRESTEPYSGTQVRSIVAQINGDNRRASKSKVERVVDLDFVKSHDWEAHSSLRGAGLHHAGQVKIYAMFAGFSHNCEDLS